MNYRVLILTVVLSAVAGEAHAVFGAVKEDDPYALRVRELEAKVQQMERVLDNQSLLQLLTELDALKNEVRLLRGEVEQLRNDVDGLQQRQRELYLDVDRRLQKLELGGGNLSGNSDTGNTAATVTGGDSDAYRAAFELLRQARYDEAAAAFAAMLQQYPDSNLAANAHYWLGESRYVTRQFEAAITEFNAVVEQFPDSNKLPDALLKIGYCFYELGLWDNSRVALDLVMQRFPGHQAAGQAEKRLARLSSEGR